MVDLCTSWHQLGLLWFLHHHYLFHLCRADFVLNWIFFRDVQFESRVKFIKKKDKQKNIFWTYIFINLDIYFIEFTIIIMSSWIQHSYTWLIDVYRSASNFSAIFRTRTFKNLNATGLETRKGDGVGTDNFASATGL